MISQEIFKKAKRAHFIGIGGIGTSAIARMFVLEGKKVSGSDMAESEVTDGLRQAGAVISIGDEEKGRPLRQRAPLFGVPADTDLVIYTIAIDKNNAELMEAKKRGIPVISYPEALGIISKEKFTIAITGTHGKTTTTAMVAKILMDAGLDPTVIVGSFLNETKTNFVAGDSKYLVVEGCEYRRSFLNLHPKILVITNIDADHLDYYKDLDDIKSAFAELAAKVPKDGFIFGHPMFEAPNIGCPNLPRDFKLKIPGKHNLENAKAALAVARALQIPDTKALASLSAFSGTWRRFEYRGKAENGALVYDDYGHHPTEIEATLVGTRELFSKQKLMVVFQPHLYSRTKQHLQGFGAAFKEANSVILLPIYPAREPDPGDINSQMVADELKKNGKDTHLVSTFDEAAALAQKLSGAGDLILTLGAGETNKVADLLVVR